MSTTSTSTSTAVDVDLRRGWTLADLDRAARNCVFISLRLHGSWVDAEDAMAEAHAEIAQEIYHPDLEEDLDTETAFRAGMRAIARFVAETQRVHGRDPQVEIHGGVVRQAGVPGEPFTDRVLDRVALAQVWAGLPKAHRDSLSAWAAAPDREAAARIVEVTRLAFNARLTKAKRLAWALWFDHETPPDFGHDRKGKPADRKRQALWRSRSNQRRRRPPQPAPAPRPRPECGTRPAYLRHLAEKEPTCELCRAHVAEQARTRSRRRKLGPRGLCGTPEGYLAHIRDRERPCEDCTDANGADVQRRVDELEQAS